VRLGEFPSDLVRIQCNDCGRSGNYKKSNLLKQYEPTAQMPDVLFDLSSDCPKRQSSGEACGAIYPDLLLHGT